MVQRPRRHSVLNKCGRVRLCKRVPNLTGAGPQKQTETISIPDTEHKRDSEHTKDEKCKGTLQQPAQVHQANVKKRNRGRRRRTRHATNSKAGPESYHIKAYKAAGLGTRDLWSFSQRNRAKALAQTEPTLDINQIKLFNPKMGMANALITGRRAGA